MNFSALDIFIGDTKAGVLFRYGDIVRFSVDYEYANDPDRPQISLSLRAEDPAQDAALLLNPTSPELNSSGGGRLPNFFQNLLPEGVLRKHIAELRKCSEDDYFELLAACGGDLPGNVYARPSSLDRRFTARFVTQQQDALEESVVEDPLEDGVSISGMQPKLALVLEGGRYVARQRHEGAHIIGKLPTTQYDLLPEVEHLSLRLAAAAGVTVCETDLVSLDLILAEHNYVIGKSNNFLAVKRFDRDQPGRLHAEDFAQILNVDPSNKYSGGSYADIANVMLRVEGLGEQAVLELVRRIAVSELLGNYDFHLKNIGVLHMPDGKVLLSPAYDIVAYSVYINGSGHALPFAHGQKKKQILEPTAIRAFANAVSMPEVKLRNEIKKVCVAAAKDWNALIDTSEIQENQKVTLKTFFAGRPVMKNYLRRKTKAVGG
ncbi:type II toxin-antitoxin system HipA family toxin [Undibacterium umbellatum]|uniref:Type II toxin-antitoxin system HipA family toxin n=1 Tax=Undibacterium umbellatum TaxID=2762300 RepID=A0ABR6ZH95_9BURK|nr:type II toxin-antitoxin system HipA family toxin [Undibacterium umbellatum]MBC3911106.1 type II toxin-antitoxin system HipA family toxin [Undibacterium umbellatum]